MTVYEGLSLRLTPAPLMRRFFSFVIDLGIVWTVSSVLAVILITLLVITIPFFVDKLPFPVERLKEPQIAAVFVFVAMLIMILLLSFLSDCYFVYYEHKRGFTPGKKCLGLKVVSLDGGRLSWGQCILREFLRYVDLGLVVPGLIAFFLTRKRQRLGDLAAGTVVIHSAQKEETGRFMYTSPEEYQFLKEALQAQPVSQETYGPYLEFSYSYFILQNKPCAASELDWWQEFALKYIPRAREKNLDQDTVLLFFAEHCFQAASKTK